MDIGFSDEAIERIEEQKICESMLRDLGHNIVTAWDATGDKRIVRALYDYIAEGHGESTKMLFTIWSGTLDNPEAEFFVRISHTDKPHTSIKKEKKTVIDLARNGKWFIPSLLAVDLPSNCTCTPKCDPRTDEETPQDPALPAIVFRWASNHTLETQTLSLDEFLDQLPADGDLYQDIERPLSELLEVATEAFDALDSDFRFGRLKEPSLPPDLWLDLTSSGPIEIVSTGNSGAHISVTEGSDSPTQTRKNSLQELLNQLEQNPDSPNDESWKLERLTPEKPWVFDDGVAYQLMSSDRGVELWLKLSETDAAKLKDVGQISLTIPSGFSELRTYQQKLVHSGLAPTALTSAQIDALLRGPKGDKKCLLARRHKDLHVGNIVANSNRLMMIDFCDEGESLYFADLAHLELSLWLSLSGSLDEHDLEQLPELLNRLADTPADEKNAPANELSPTGKKLFAASSSIRNLVAKLAQPHHAQMSPDEIAFNYWYVAFSTQQYDLLAERSENYRRVKTEWTRFWLERMEGQGDSGDELVDQMRDYASRVADRWDAEVEKLKKADRRTRGNDVDRLDCFVAPQLKWEEPATDVWGRDYWIQHDVGGDQEDQLKKAFHSARAEGRWLVISDGAGAGKTVLTRRFESDLSAEGLKQSGVPWVVFRISIDTKNLNLESVFETISQDDTLRKVVPSKSKRIALLEHAAEFSRLVVIVDGYDEFSDDERSAFEKLLDPRSGASNHEKIAWVFTGRQYAVRDAYIRNALFRERRFSMLRIEAFSEEMQDEYFHRDPLPFDKGKSWRDYLTELSEIERRTLLSLPHTLRELRRCFESALLDKTAIPHFDSPSRLFLITSRQLLNTELRKTKTDAWLNNANASKVFPDDVLLHLEHVLGAIAFEMMLAEHFRRVRVPRHAIKSEIIRKVKTAAKTRFVGGFHKTYPDRDAHEVWDQAIDLLTHIAMDNRGTAEGFGQEYLAFPHRIVHEMHCARYLVTYATADDLDALRPHIGDDEWEQVWKGAIQMPLRNELQQGGELEHYEMVLHRLFERTDRASGFRRPTRLMYAALRWLRGKHPHLDSPSRRKLRKLADELKAGLRNELTDLMSNGTKRQQHVAQDLVPSWGDPEQAPYVVLSYQPSPDEPDQTVNYWLKRQPVTNAQFQLFDPNHLGEHEWCQPENAPVTFCSYCDAMIFCEFVGTSRSPKGTLRATLPQPLQWLHAMIQSDRAGLERKHFCCFDTEKTDLDEISLDGAGLKAMYNSGFEWCRRAPGNKSTEGMALGGDASNSTNQDAHAWPNAYYVVPGLRPEGGRYQNVTFRIAFNC